MSTQRQLQVQTTIQSARDVARAEIPVTNRVLGPYYETVSYGMRILTLELWST